MMIGNILIVDDELDTLKLLNKILISEGHVVRSFNNGELALRSIVAEPPELILLDIRMPGMSGFDVCRQLQKDERLKEIPVIFISAASDIDDKVKAFQEGGVDFITKPFQKEEIIVRVKTHIALSHTLQRMKKVVDTLRISEENLKMAQSIAQLGHWEWDIKSGQFVFSEEIYRMLGVESQEKMTNQDSFLMRVHPDDRARVANHFCELLAGNSFDIEYRIILKNGEVHIVHGKGKLFYTGPHKEKKAMGTIQDIHTQNEKVALGIIQDITFYKKIEENFRALLEATPDALVISNKEGQIVLMNELAEKLFGYSRKELIGQQIELLLPARFVTKHQEHRQNYYKSPRVRPMGAGLELYAKHKDGHEFSVEISLAPLETKEGLLVLAAVRDITERKKIEDAKAMLSALVEHSDDAIIGKDLNGIMFSWNKAAEEFYGYTATEAIGKPVTMLCPQDRTDEFDKIMNQIMAGEHIKNIETLRIHKDGRVIPVSITVSPIRNMQGKVIGASTTARDISKQKQFEEQLKHLAEHDALTDLVNRPIFEDHIIQALSIAKRLKTNVVVCFLDLDDFKQINDLYGHHIGDLLLCAAANCIKSCIRESDTLSRFGGDEFALLLLNINDEKDVIKIVKKIIKCFEKGFSIENKKLMITLSIGIAMYPRDGQQLLLKKADSAMYYVKEHGKNNFKFFDDKVNSINN